MHPSPLQGSTYGEGGLHLPSPHWPLLECISPSLVFGTFSRLFGPPWTVIHLKSCQPEQCDITCEWTHIPGLSVRLRWKTSLVCLASEAATLSVSAEQTHVVYFMPGTGLDVRKVHSHINTWIIQVIQLSLSPTTSEALEISVMNIKYVFSLDEMTGIKMWGMNMLPQRGKKISLLVECLIILNVLSRDTIWGLILGWSAAVHILSSRGWHFYCEMMILLVKASSHNIVYQSQADSVQD